MAFDWTSVLTGGAGGLIGIIGNIGNTWLSMKQQKQQHEYEIAMLPLKLDADLQRNKAEVAKVVETGAAAGFVASQEADRLSGNEHSWAADVKAMVRPTILFLLFAGVVAIFTSGHATEDMKSYITQNIVTDFSMAVSWYFGARATALVMQGYQTKAK